jgi:hypothetical protein
VSSEARINVLGSNLPTQANSQLYTLNDSNSTVNIIAQVFGWFGLTCFVAKIRRDDLKT